MIPTSHTTPLPLAQPSTQLPLSQLRIGFAGTPEFAAVSLRALIAAGLPPVLALTQPDRAQGRGMKLVPSPVKQCALDHNIPVLQPASLRSAETQAPLLAQPLDVLLVAAYGLILPPAILAWPRFGCLNVHASLLPRWRGAAPIQHALLAGDTITGITLMQMDAGLDTGAMIDTASIAITGDTTGGSLHDALAAAGAQLAVAVLRRLIHDGSLRSTPQDNALATYAGKIERAHAELDWQEDALSLERKVRAFNPVPAAYTILNGAPLKIWRAQALPSQTGQADLAPGTVIAAHQDGIDIACRNSVFRILELQPANGKRMTAAAFLAGRPLASGTRMGRPAP